MKDVVIFGLGDFARIAQVYLEADSPYSVAGFTANREHVDAPEYRGMPLVPFEELEERFPPDRYAMFVAIGFSRVNKARAEIYEECKQRGYELISYVNSRAMQWGEVEIGDNCFVFEANVLQPFVKIGNDVILWSGNHIGHDVTIGDHCFIASHAVISGNVTIGPYCFIGVNATFRDGVTVGPECVIGADATIMHDTQPGEVFSLRHTEPRSVKSWDLKGF